MSVSNPQSDFKLLLGYIAGQLASDERAQLEQRLASDKNLQVLYNRILNLDQFSEPIKQQVRTSLEWSPEEIAMFVDGTLADDRADILASNCLHDDGLMTEVLSTFRFTEVIAVPEFTPMDGQVVGMPLEVAAFVEPKTFPRPTSEKLAGRGWLSVVAASMLIAVTAMAFLISDGPNGEAIAENSPQPRYLLSPAERAAYDEAERKRDPIRFRYAMHYPDSVPVEIEWTKVRGVVGQRSRDATEADEWVGVEADCKNPVDFVALGDSTAWANLPDGSVVSFNPNTRALIFRETATSPITVRVLNGSVHFWRLKKGKIYHIQHFPKPTIVAQVLDDLSGIGIEFEHYNFTTRISAGKVRLSGTGCEQKGITESQARTYKPASVLTQGFERQWWPRRLEQKAYGKPKRLVRSIDLPNDITAALNASETLVADLGKLPDTFSEFRTRAILGLDSQSSYFTLLTSKDDVEQQTAVSWLFGRETGSMSRARVFRSLGANGVAREVSTAIARTTGQGPYSHSYESIRALAKGMDHDEHGVRALSHRACVRAFPNFPQVTDYKPSDSPSLRKIALEQWGKWVDDLAHRLGADQNPTVRIHWQNE